MFYYVHGLLVATMCGDLFFNLERYIKKIKIIHQCQTNKLQLIFDIYPAELKVDHKFNFAEQAPPCFTLCVCVEGVCLLFASGLWIYKNKAEDLSALCEVKVCCSRNVSVHIQRRCAIKALKYLFVTNCFASESFNALQNLLQINSKSFYTLKAAHIFSQTTRPFITVVNCYLGM